MNILFVCTGNTCRSPMAEGILKKIVTKLSLNNINASSAGISADNTSKATENAIKVCKEIGVDLSNHVSKNISDVNLSNFDRVVVMTDWHKNVLRSLNVTENKISVLGGQIQDPYAGSIEVYRDCRDQIYDALQKLLMDKAFIGRVND